MDSRNCPACGGNMKAISKKYAIGKRGKYRIRKFKCTLCDFEEAVYAAGTRDDLLELDRAKKQIDKEYDNETKARE